MPLTQNAVAESERFRVFRRSVHFSMRLLATYSGFRHLESNQRLQVSEALFTYIRVDIAQNEPLGSSS